MESTPDVMVVKKVSLYLKIIVYIATRFPAAPQRNSLSRSRCDESPGRRDHHVNLSKIHVKREIYNGR